MSIHYEHEKLSDVLAEAGECIEKLLKELADARATLRANFRKIEEQEPRDRVYDTWSDLGGALTDAVGLKLRIGDAQCYARHIGEEIAPEERAAA